MTEQVSETKIEGLPKHVAIIMDGNGRWATKKGKSRTYGHKAGSNAVQNAITFARRNDIEALTLFAFSSENWARPESEVSVLMELFITVLQREVAKLKQHGVRLRVIGDVSRFSPKLQKRIRQAEEQTEENTALILNIAANYGGRWDIAAACQQVAQRVKLGELEPEQIDESLLGEYMQLADIPTPDLLIRTGGDIRISNFLLWQLAYAELYFTDTLWPDFDDQTFADAIDSFMQRERRFGLTSEQRQQMLAEG
ncbi:MULTISPECIES: polyprenyl diphosphate synthase [Gammaproteobacteria]|uniref:polyprenyl diphosphate synthase n=1 Tax=Gammaproteobacteria TaxID=1236 RepID=UPI000DD02755|nr:MULTISPECIES: polyprenyl diphosphate synthase [Gammaproteobacteria]RTE86997.1 di-trans,poly-cis-decaprenylcistransferase [Aliidiomarina sp. B3213]TCZ93213.1 di-trans,poly-cis-decaprenylcistransferase [Lysobacter sp. N42]